MAAGATDSHHFMHHIKTVFGDKTDKSHTSVLHRYLLYAVFFRKEDGRECAAEVYQNGYYIFKFSRFVYCQFVFSVLQILR